MAVKPIVAAFALGAVTVAGFAPFYFYPLPPVTLAAFALLLLRAASTRRAAAIGFSFGLGLLLTGASWAYVSLHDYGGMPMPVAAACTLIFNAAYALCPALAAALIYRLRAPNNFKLLLLFPALMALSDWARGWLFTGFPWLSLGYSQAPASPLAGYAATFGVYGVSLFTALVAGCLALAWLRISDAVAAARGASVRTFTSWLAVLFKAAAGPVSVFTVIIFAGFALGRIEWTRPVDGQPVSVTLVQGNIAQEIKWRPEHARTTLLTYLELVRASPSKLIILPETAIPMFNVNVPPDYLEALAAHARKNGGDLLTGIPEYASTGKYYNSVISLGKSPSQTYRKVHLVPFGDYFPMQWALGWLLNMLDIPMSDFSPGKTNQRPIAAAGQKIAVDICYEDVFGEEIIRQLPEATLLANFTNDAWWGRSLASQQHLQISQMRSLETGRSMLRTTNTGVTAVIDYRGRIQAQAPQFETTVVNTQVRGRSGATPYVRWGNYAFLLLALTMIVAGAAIGRARKSRQQ